MSKLNMVPVFVETDKSLPLMNVTIAFRTGSAHDPEGSSGLASVTARMLRRGSKLYPCTSLEESLDRIGCEMSTSAGSTNSAVHFTVLKRSIGKAVDIVSDMLVNPAFDANECEKLIAMSLAETGSYANHDKYLAGVACMNSLFGLHPFAKTGMVTQSSAAMMTTAAMRSFHADCYTAENAVIGISGDITEDEGKELAAKILGSLTAKSSNATLVLDEPSVKDGRHLVFVDKPDRNQMSILVGGLGMAPGDDDMVALEVGCSIFGGGIFNSRLMEEVRTKRGWSYGSSMSLRTDTVRSAFRMSAAPAAKDAAGCLSLQLGMLSTLISDGVTQGEVDFMKGYLAKSNAFNVDSADKRVTGRMNEVLYGLPAGHFSQYAASVVAVTIDEVNAALKARLSAENLTIAVVGTAKTHGDEIKRAVENCASMTVVGFEDVLR